MSGDDFLQGLDHLEGSKVPTYYSTEAKARAEKLSRLAEDCVHFIDEFFESKVQNRPLVLIERDWMSARAGLVKRLEATHRGLGGWLRDWVQENP
jgi:hypothetical protein